MPEGERNDKYRELLNILRACGRVAVAYSGGVDSSLLAHAAQEALGDSAVAITAQSPFSPERELREAQEFCEQQGIEHVTIPVDVLADEGIAANPPERCYLCKRTILGRIADYAQRHGVNTVVEGSNADDDDALRPGSRAVRELGVQSPLRAVGLTKDEIRELSCERGLPTWDKQSFSCLATRFEFGDALTPERLALIDSAEQFLLDLGLRQVRVRCHGQLARIELSEEDLPRALEDSVRLSIVHKLRELGFSHVTLDLAGYQPGSMDCPLDR